MDMRTQIGRIGLTYAIKYYTEQGFTVSIPLDDTQWYDLIIEQNGRLEFVQCRATDTDKNTIDLRSTGGTNGGVYDHVFNHPIDRMFCVDAQRNGYDIPVVALKAFCPTMQSFQLHTTVALNNQGFPSQDYLVK